MAATNMNLTGIGRKLVMEGHQEEAVVLQALEQASKESRH